MVDLKQKELNLNELQTYRLKNFGFIEEVQPGHTAGQDPKAIVLPVKTDSGENLALKVSVLTRYVGDHSNGLNRQLFVISCPKQVQRSSWN
jgi:hypothetical protein